MNTDKKTMLSFFNKDKVKRIVIPVYQRTYSWDKDDVERLLDDIIHCAKEETKRSHFFGTLFVEEEKGKEGEERRNQILYIVDGQQRILTISIILKAFELILKEKAVNQELQSEIAHYLSMSDGTGRPYICASKLDRLSYEKIISLKDERPISNLEKNRLKEALAISRVKIKEFIDNGGTPNQFFDGLNKLEIAYISLTKDDDVQTIFESINALGKELTQGDLVRNYLLMKINDESEQKELYEDHYLVLEKLLGNSLEDFIRIFVLMKSQERIDEKNIYHTYVEQVEKNSDKVPDRGVLIRELLKWGERYHAFVDPEKWSGEDRNRKKIARIITEFISIRTKGPYPFLLRVLGDVDEKGITLETAEKVFNLILVYVVRVSIVSSRSASIFRDVFLTLYKKCFGDGKNISNDTYYQTIYKYLHYYLTSNPMPSMDEVTNKLNSIELYKDRRNLTSYLLIAIENNRWKGKDSVELKIDNVSIEHIIPQNWVNWTRYGDFDDIWLKEHIHMLGNLTAVTKSMNSSLSNAPYEKKRAELLDETKGYGKFKILNGLIDKNEKWSKELFYKRQQELIKVIESCYKLAPVEHLEKALLQKFV